jgi:hypothetical protein
MNRMELYFLFKNFLCENGLIPGNENDYLNLINYLLKNCGKSAQLTTIKFL